MTTKSRIMHSLMLAGGLLFGFALSCVPVLTGAPCRTDANCPSGQVCGANLKCDVGGGGAGSSDGGRVDGGGTVPDAGADFVFDAGRGEGTAGGTCFDGRDNDNDGATDCADSDCATQPCRAPRGICDAIETCVAGMTTCPADGFAPTTRTCGPAAGCGDGTLVQQSFCDGTGSCGTKVPVSCNGYACTAGACKTSCAGASDCDSLHRCSGGRCVSSGVNGAACISSSDCTSGHCADKRCCNTSCVGDCDSCDNPTGTCGRADTGTDPRNKCGSYTCNTSGACDTACGMGGAVCGNSSCKSDTLCLGAACTAKKFDGLSCEADCECNTGRCTTFYVDGDGDGYGTAVSIRQCGTLPKAGFSTNPGDCNDLDRGVNPNAAEVPGDGVDSNCDKQELCFIDEDGDGYRSLPETTELSSDLTCASGRSAPSSMPGQDRCDKDANASPKVTTASALLTACGDYDWNTDGIITPQYQFNYSCDLMGRCRPGWAIGTSIPKCGVQGNFVTCSSTGCTGISIKLVQPCL